MSGETREKLLEIVHVPECPSVVLIDCLQRFLCRLLCVETKILVKAVLGKIHARQHEI